MTTRVRLLMSQTLTNRPLNTVSEPAGKLRERFGNRASSYPSLAVFFGALPFEPFVDPPRASVITAGAPATIGEATKPPAAINTAFGVPVAPNERPVSNPW